MPVAYIQLAAGRAAKQRALVYLHLNARTTSLRHHYVIITSIRLLTATAAPDDSPAASVAAKSENVITEDD